jgi:hypothetical protein
MKKNHTLLYLLDNSNQRICELIKLNEDFDEFEDIFRALEQMEEEPDQVVVDKIIRYARST